MERTTRRWVVVAAAAALAVAATIAAAQVATPVGTETPPPTPVGTTTEALHLVDLAADTFVAVKDLGDSQTVLVYKLSPEGKLRLTDQKRFFYK